MNKPLYKHDSDCCTYFKTDLDMYGQMSDIYICGKHIMFRYSDEPANNRCCAFDKNHKYFDFFKEGNEYAYKLFEEFYQNHKDKEKYI